MSRTIVHKTKSKLDLRSITTFGLNAKPNSDTPIGYFGTGLKYALAVLARENISVAIYIDGKKWTLESKAATFRDKKFSSLYLQTMRGKILSPKILELPFTTDLGKNWEIWQAFRELECNTRDEKGETFIAREYNDPERPIAERGDTYFVIEDERYVNEYLNMDKHFLKGGMTSQTGTYRLQVFPVKSDCIYYRGIRIHDLKEPSNNTYNFLCQIELTEDRTAKSPWTLEYEIEQFLGSQTEETQFIERAITAPEKTYERRFAYTYTTKSEAFLNTIESHGEDATPNTRTALRDARPPERPKDVDTIWQRSLMLAIDREDFDAVVDIIQANRDECISLLEQDAVAYEKEQSNNVRVVEGNQRET
jgi:hypothetical protein